MENKYVGYLLLGISLVIIVIILLFNSALQTIVNTSCSAVGHGDSCPMYDTITQQTILSVIIVFLVVLVALFLILSKPQKEFIFKTRTIEKKIQKKKLDTSDLKEEEKQVLELIQSNKAVFQSALIEKTGFGKAKMTRIIDRLEGKGFVERKRRGMTDVVVLKDI